MLLPPDNNKKYKLLVEKLYERCQEIQTENERNVLRITNIKKIIRRRLRDVEILKHRLDRYNDCWRSCPMVAPHPKRKIEQKRGPKPKPKDPNEPTKEKKVRKRRVQKNAIQPTTTGTGQVVAELMNQIGEVHGVQRNILEHKIEQQTNQLQRLQHPNNNIV